MKKLLSLGLIVLSIIALLAPTAALAAKPGGNQAELNSLLVTAADLHLSRQGTYSGIPDTWEWKIGSFAGYWNVVGISATGLLAAYEKTGDTDYLDGAILTGNTLVANYDAITSRPYSQDIEFLARLAADSGDPSFLTKAASYYSRVTGAFTAVENADRYINARLSLAGWDLASQIRAAVAVGNTDYATGMVTRLIERRVDWEDAPYGGWNYTTVSHASLLWALRDLSNTSFSAYTDEIRTSLLAAQETGGSWDGGDYQTTAYAILGLDRPRTPATSSASAEAWVFLRDNNTAGGWVYSGTEYGEVNSEVIMALGILNLDEGKKLGHTDPNPDNGNDSGNHPLIPEP